MPPDTIERTSGTLSRAYGPPVTSPFRRHRVSPSLLEADDGRLVAHLERRTPWDS